MAVALLAAGVLVRTLPLESTRPHDAVPTAASAIGEQDVRARLWQDPFEVVPRPAKREAPEQRSERLKREDPLHAPEKLAAQLDKAIATPGARVTILGVMVFGSPYAEDVELRRRTRYAVLSGLAGRHYVPDNPGALGYVWTDVAWSEDQSTGDPWTFAAWTDDEPRKVPPKRVRLPEVVPYEWFTLERPRGSKGEARRQAAQKEIPGSEKVLVLWLDEDGFGDAALRGLSALVRQIGCGAGAEACRDLEAAASVRILGPAGSGTFKSIIEDANTLQRPPADQVKLQFVSAFATVPKSEADEVPKAWREKLAILRVIGGDDDLAVALLDELALRRVNAVPPGGQCRDGIVLVSEWDTDYGRSLPA